MLCSVQTLRSSRALSVHMAAHAGATKLFICDVCSREFTQNSNLIAHKRMHSEDKPFKCQVEGCGMAFTWQNSLLRHRRGVHENVRPFGCEICAKTFQRSSHLQQHLRKHSGERPFKCDLCDKAFAQKGNLNLHMRTHTKEQPYQCTVCTKSFPRRGDLTVHMRSHTGERPYACTVCAATFSTRSHVLRHERLHRRGDDPAGGAALGGGMDGGLVGVEDDGAGGVLGAAAAEAALLPMPSTESVLSVMVLCEECKEAEKDTTATKKCVTCSDKFLCDSHAKYHTSKMRHDVQLVASISDAAYEAAPQTTECVTRPGHI